MQSTPRKDIMKVECDPMIVSVITVVRRHSLLQNNKQEEIHFGIYGSDLYHKKSPGEPIS